VHIQEGVYLCSNCLPLHRGLSSGDQLAGFVVQHQRNSSSERIRGISCALAPFFYRGLMKEETVLKDYEKPLIQAREAIAAQCDFNEEEG